MEQHGRERGSGNRLDVMVVRHRRATLGPGPSYRPVADRDARGAGRAGGCSSTAAGNLTGPRPPGNPDGTLRDPPRGWAAIGESRVRGSRAIITARELLGGEPVVYQAEGHVALMAKNKKQHDTSEQGPRTCQIYVTPSRLLLFHELPLGWWGHDYEFGQIESVDTGSNHTLVIRATDHSARVQLATGTERDALQTALKEAQAGIQTEAAVSDDRLAAEARVRTLRKLLEDGKLTQDEYDHQAIQLLGLGAPPPSGAEDAEPPPRKRIWRR
jgi:hypothetical protein